MRAGYHSMKCSNSIPKANSILIHFSHTHQQQLSRLIIRSHDKSVQTLGWKLLSKLARKLSSIILCSNFWHENGPSLHSMHLGPKIFGVHLGFFRRAACKRTTKLSACVISLVVGVQNCMLRRHRIEFFCG